MDLFNIDVEKLFEQHTISEILEIQKKIQHELDKKKHDLRFMIGERYRDVIAAADAIKTMQHSAEMLNVHVDHIKTECYQLQSSANNGNGMINEERRQPLLVVDKVKLFQRSIAIQIKILISIPEYIWMCLDNNDYLKAVHLYLLATHIHTGLELDREHKIVEKFPILSKLKLSINSFRNRILDGIVNRLQAVNLNPEEASNHLCAYMLLENKSQESVLSEFIILREKSLKDLLNVDISVHNVVRVQITNLMNCLICTIRLLRACFIGDDNYPEGLVQINMKSLLSSDYPNTIKYIDLESTQLLEYLPPLINDFRPSYSNEKLLLEKNGVEKIVSNWLQSTSVMLNDNLTKSLILITSVKVLQNIREEALRIESTENWNSICTMIYLPEHFTVWYYFFQPLVSKRAQKLICDKVENSLSYLYKQFDKSFKSVINDRSEKDLRWYVWCEDPEDLSRNTNNHTGLIMKTKGHSTRVANLCKEIDDKYLELLQDVNIYLTGAEENTVNSKLNSERIHLEDCLRIEANSSIEKLINYIDKLVDAELDNSMKVMKSVMAARLLQAISHLCPNLVRCCSYGKNVTEWNATHTCLVNRTIQFWNEWLNDVQTVVKKLLTEFMANVQFNNMLQILPRWDTIEIEEQTDDKTFSSKIRIPSQPSITVLSILSEISNEFNAALPHTLPKLVHTQFIEQTIALILQQYELLTQDETLNQNIALQFLLDVKFLTTLCIKRDNKELLKKSECICDTLRSKVDPFDFDVFYPYLKNNVTKSVQQLHTIFGCLLPTPLQLASIGTAEMKNIDVEPCVIAISVPSTEMWFPLLPITAPTSKTVHQLPSSASKSTQMKRDVSLSKDGSESSSIVRSGAAALFGAMTSDWFS